jgi:hypothetical protein
LEAQKQPGARPDRVLIDKRHQPRFKLEVKIAVKSRTCGLLKGQTVEISESGISAILRIEVSVGELVELEFTLPFGLVTIYAMVRQRNAFRYGFQFVESISTKAIIQSTCRRLAVEQTLLDGN